MFKRHYCGFSDFCKTNILAPDSALVTITLLNQDIHFSKISYEQSAVSRNSVTYRNTSMAGTYPQFVQRLRR